MEEERARQETTTSAEGAADAKPAEGGDSAATGIENQQCIA